MSIIVDLPHRQTGAARARPIKPDEPGTTLRGSGGVVSDDGAEIILFPRPKCTGDKRVRKPLKRRFAVRAARGAGAELDLGPEWTGRRPQ